MDAMLGALEQLAPLQPAGRTGVYRFVHKSFLEYFGSLLVRGVSVIAAPAGVSLPSLELPGVPRLASGAWAGMCLWWFGCIGLLLH